MGRYFDEHRIQKVDSLNGTWDFCIDPDNVGENENWFIKLPKCEKVTVPSVWNTQLGLLEYEGAAWYQKIFYCDGGRIKLHFGAVMTKADIWLDGVRLEGHYGGFCEFDRIAYADKGYHTLTVRADNSFDAYSVPQKNVDWYHYGGITRDVSYEILSGICVLSNRFEYTLSGDLKKANCGFKIRLYNAENETVTSNITVKLDSSTVYSGSVTLSAEETRVFTTPLFTIDNIRLWDIGKPELYTVEINTDTYDIFDRVGFRRIEVDSGKILLNGKSIEIRGVNRHEEHPDHGMAFPVSLMKRDLDIFTEMGGNAIRGSHYPNSREFVDMLDERGIMFWSEVPVWGVGFSVETLGDETVVQRILDMHAEMLDRYYNHPSIIIWGMHNEIRSETENAYKLTKRCYELIKPAGGNRLITFASCIQFEDICFEFCDIICINAYYGWYNGDVAEWEKFAKKFRQRRADLKMEHKPVIISEFGAAALYGNHTFDNIKWGEEYQAGVMDKCINLFHNDDMCAGCYVWQFCNIRTCDEMGLNRARGFNNKGLLDEYRRPKMAYFKVKELYNKFKNEE